MRPESSRGGDDPQRNSGPQPTRRGWWGLSAPLRLLVLALLADVLYVVAAWEAARGPMLLGLAGLRVLSAVVALIHAIAAFALLAEVITHWPRAAAVRRAMALVAMLGLAMALLVDPWLLIHVGLRYRLGQDDTARRLQAWSLEALRDVRGEPWMSEGRTRLLSSRPPPLDDPVQMRASTVGHPQDEYVLLFWRGPTNELWGYIVGSPDAVPMPGAWGDTRYYAPGLYTFVIWPGP